GYVHAQDRFWQMDFQRHVGSGRLSELLGRVTVDTDIFLRTLGWERVAQQELERLSAESLRMLEAYAAGVNAYLANHEGTELSLEYLFLGLLNNNYQPAPWTPLNTLVWAKAMAWDLRDNMDTEIERAILLNSLPEERVAELFPNYPDDAPIIIPDYQIAESPLVNQASWQSMIPSETTRLFERMSKQVAAIDGLLGGEPDAELGSNSWVISGELSATGAPLMANDPHLDASIPSIWYENGLHCLPKGPDCDFDVMGFSFVGAPGVVLGHNDRIAWGMTNVGADVMDLFIIKVNPEDPNQYEMNGEWIDMEVLTEEILVAGGETIELPVRITQFGPIISDSFGDLTDFDQNSGIELPEHYAIALSWTALMPGDTFESIFRINRARNFEEFREAASLFAVPSQNLVYADVDGNIGYQLPGWIPVRATGDGRLPVLGWTDEYAWTGFVPFEELPYALNPDSGYIVAANNAIVGADYPYLIADTWDFGNRARRVVDLIEAASGLLDIEYFKSMQSDSRNLGALAMIPYLEDLEFSDVRVAELRDQLLDWDGQQTIDSSDAAIFNSFYLNLLGLTFHDDLPQDYWPSGGNRWYVIFQGLLADPENEWWDDKVTETMENRDAILTSAFEAGIAELHARLGREPTEWHWGDLHTITFQHGVMNDFPLINLLFNRGPFASAGGSAIVNATAWDATNGDFSIGSLPSMRSIVDLGNLQNSLQIHITGQSGHVYHDHYADMSEVWAEGDYLPMHWDRQAIIDDSESHLILMP
ncbi:MAG: penicillin acylase family protein, partial [Anaerolineales bacterium]